MSCNQALFLTISSFNWKFINIMNRSVKWILGSSLLKRLIQTTPINFKGHSKWQNIKNIKAANDFQRCMTISRQTRLIKFAVHGLSIVISESTNSENNYNK